MKKLPYQMKAIAYVLFYLILTSATYWIGNEIKDQSFAFGMIQITLTTALLLVYYPMLAKERKKLGYHIPANVMYGLMCAGLFAIASLSGYLNLMGSVPQTVITRDLPALMVVFLVVTTLFCFTLNEVALIMILQGFPFKGQDAFKAMVVFVVYVLTKIGIVAFLFPNSLLISAVQAIVIAITTTILLATKKSVFLVPIAATIIGILFLTIL